MSKVFFTVFTPLYNRKHTIHRVWESLNQQTVQNFEWLIVNDGSEDGVESLLESYKKEANFEVRIFHQKNSGKHIAFNKAIDEAKGELLVPADSDDSFIATTLETFEKNWIKYKNDSISGISVLCMDSNENIMGDYFPNISISNHNDMVYKYKIKGEKWGCIRVDLLKKYKFPNMLGANFFPESYIWSQMALEYDTAYLNIPLRVYHQDAGNQIMKSTNKSKGTLEIANFYTIWWLNEIYPAVRKYLTIKQQLRRYVSVWNSSFLNRTSPYELIKKIKSPKSKIILAILIVPSYLLHVLYKFKK